VISVRTHCKVTKTGDLQQGVWVGKLVWFRLLGGTEDNFLMGNISFKL